MENVEMFILINKSFDKDFSEIKKIVKGKVLLLGAIQQPEIWKTGYSLSMFLGTLMDEAEYLNAELGQIENFSYIGFRKIAEIKDNVKTLIMVCNSVVIGAMIKFIETRRGLNMGLLNPTRTGQAFFMDLSDPKNPKWGHK